MKDAILGLDGALGPFSVALISATGAFPDRALAGRGNDALELGLELVSRVLGDLQPAALERIVVTAGPGSFTGLRIAAAYAKSIAFAAGVPLVALDSFDVLEPPEAGPGAFALGVIASRAGRVNVRLRTPEAVATFGGPFAEVAERVAALVPAGCRLLVTGDAAGVSGPLGERGLHVSHVSLPSPIALAVASRGRSRRPLASAHALVANYGSDGPAHAADVS